VGAFSEVATNLQYKVDRREPSGTADKVILRLSRIRLAVRNSRPDAAVYGLFEGLRGELNPHGCDLRRRQRYFMRSTHSRRSDRDDVCPRAESPHKYISRSRVS